MENLGSNIRDAKRDDKHRAIICRTKKLQTVKQDSNKKKSNAKYQYLQEYLSYLPVRLTTHKKFIQTINNNFKNI